MFHTSPVHKCRPHSLPVVVGVGWQHRAWLLPNRFLRQTAGRGHARAGMDDAGLDVEDLRFVDGVVREKVWCSWLVDEISELCKWWHHPPEIRR